MSTYGRNRDSVADIEQSLYDVFQDHPDSYTNDNGDIIIPASALLDVIHELEAKYDGLQLFSEEEQESFKSLVANTPGLELTPSLLVQFIAERTKISPPLSPKGSASDIDPDSSLDDDFDRGRSPTREEDLSGFNSRSSSVDSSGTSVWMGSVPQTPKRPSPFDTSKRQRTTPLAPSSYRRPQPLSRRKSDAGSRSESESASAPPPSSFSRKPGRHRNLSNPTSPEPLASVSSPPFARPHSRTQSHSPFGISTRYSPDHEADDSDVDILSPGVHEGSFVSTIPLPGSGEQEEEDPSDFLIMERSTASSLVSLEPNERLEALQRDNADLRRRLAESDRTLQNKLLQHESEIEEMQVRLEDLRSELTSTKREEKELRAKERSNIQSISNLEADITRLNKALENSRATYVSLQKQYQEQCAAAEQYREELRLREEAIRALKEAASLHELESSKWKKEVETYEFSISSLQEQLSLAQQAHDQLSDQKQENLLLKETIDRMRFDMDELRNSATGAKSSAPNSISKGTSWSDQLRRAGEQFNDVDEETVSVEVEEDTDESETEIVTTRRRRHKKGTSRPYQNKDYMDQECQTDVVPEAPLPVPEPKPELVVHFVQTDEIEEVRPETIDSFAQTSPPVMVDTEVSTVNLTIYSSAEVQADPVENVRSASPNPEASTSTIVPPTPPKSLIHHHDEPPAYDQLDAHDWGRIAEILKKWHPGLKHEHQLVEDGVSMDAVEDWKALKEELGVSCDAIENIIARSKKNTQPRASKDGKLARRGRFYNIYNTYFYGDPSRSTGTLLGGVASHLVQVAVVAGASALVYMAVNPHMMQPISVPGGPTYYDRSAWNSFNSMQAAGEGFAPDGTAVVWNFLGRVGGGAARIARGLPT